MPESWMIEDKTVFEETFREKPSSAVSTSHTPLDCVYQPCWTPSDTFESRFECFCAGSFRCIKEHIVQGAWRKIWNYTPCCKSWVLNHLKPKLLKISHYVKLGHYQVILFVIKRQQHCQVWLHYFIIYDCQISSDIILSVTNRQSNITKILFAEVMLPGEPSTPQCSNAK